MQARDEGTDRPGRSLAAATSLLYDELKAQIKEVRAELTVVDATTRSIQLSIERMHGENVAEQVKENRASIAKLEERVAKLDDKLTERIVALEKFQSNLTGRLIVLAALAMFGASILGGLLLKALAK